MTSWLTPDEQQAWRAFLSATALISSALDAQLQRDADMPHGYYEVLVRLSEASDRTLRMSELAAATLSSRSRLSHAVGRLELRGWVTRRPCPTDKRGQLATLTPAGFAVLQRSAPGHVAAVRQALFAALSAEQVGQLRGIGEAIAAHHGGGCLSGPQRLEPRPEGTGLEVDAGLPGQR